MPLGFLLLGIALGLVFAVVYRRLPSAASAWSRSIGLAVTGFTALALLPQLRYPANPPRIGDPETVGARTVSYLLAVALGVAVVTGTYAALHAMRARGIPLGGPDGGGRRGGLLPLPRTVGPLARRCRGRGKGMTMTRKQFSVEYREEAAKMVIEGSKPIAQLARDLGLNEGTLGN